jgi:hypothetical protein
VDHLDFKERNAKSAHRTGLSRIAGPTDHRRAYVQLVRTITSI